MVEPNNDGASLQALQAYKHFYVRIMDRALSARRMGFHEYVALLGALDSRAAPLLSPIDDDEYLHARQAYKRFYVGVMGRALTAQLMSFHEYVAVLRAFDDWATNAAPMLPSHTDTGDSHAADTAAQ